MEILSRKIIVLDDDPTGTQTVHDISVYTDWEYETILNGFTSDDKMFFILTNSRSFSAERTRTVHQLIAGRIARAAAATGLDYLLISRGDSTLRGHYPLETETLRDEIEKTSAVRFDGEIICPFFPEGGRYTIGDIHYVREGERLIPAGETEFARDQTFGYQSSNLTEYIAEKTGGVYQPEDCISISIEDLRSQDPAAITSKLMAAKNFQKIIVNAETYADLAVFCTAWIQVMNAGHHFLVRSAAALTKVIGGISDIPLLSRDKLLVSDTANGGIVIIGSHVQKTTRQLMSLRELEGCENNSSPLAFLEFEVNAYFSENGLAHETTRILALAEAALAAGKTAVIYTSRKLLVPDHATRDEILAASVSISSALTAIVRLLSVTPRFILAKGGITSSDVATKGLGIKKATVIGQIRKGIPVWLTGPESKFPGMPYIIFPGNVGEDTTLRDIVTTLL